MCARTWSVSCSVVLRRSLTACAPCAAWGVRFNTSKSAACALQMQAAARACAQHLKLVQRGWLLHAADSVLSKSALLRTCSFSTAVLRLHTTRARLARRSSPAADWGAGDREVRCEGEAGPAAARAHCSQMLQRASVRAPAERAPAASSHAARAYACMASQGLLPAQNPAVCALRQNAAARERVRAPGSPSRHR